MRILFISSIVLLSNLFGFSQEVSQGILLAHWEDSSLVGSDAYDNTYNEVWGLNVNDKEYAIIGSTAGTHFIDVTDTDNVEEAFFVAGASAGGQIIHRDYHDHNGLLYAVSDEGFSTLQIMDISTLPDSVPVLYDSREYIRRSHNIFIDTTESILYACIAGGNAFPFTAMASFDIADGADPQFIRTYDDIQGVPISQVHDGYFDGGIGYLNLGPGGFMIADFTDPNQPQVLSTLESGEYPDAGYNHSGYVSEDKTHYYMADENWDADMKVIDVGDLLNPEVIGTFDADNEDPFSIAHNQVVAGDFLYVSYYYDGLQVYDISDPAMPVRVMEYKTSELSPRNSYEGAWGVYPFLKSGNILVSDMQNGLFVIQNPSIASNTHSVDIEPKFSVYPNPVTDKLLVNFTEEKNCIIEISTMNGLKVLEQEVQAAQFEVDMSSFERGAYTVSVFQAGASSSKVVLVK